MRKLMTVGATCAAVLGATAGHAFAQTPALKRETLRLDTHSTSKRNAGPVSTQRDLKRKTWYTVTVSGTFTLDVFQRRIVRNRSNFCGAAEDAPQRLSRNGTTAPVFVDAEMFFALPLEWADRASDCANLPLHHGAFQMTAARKWSHVEPVGGVPAATSAKHAYRYLLRGAGRKARFRLLDANPRDNSGVLTIRIRRARASELPKPTPTPAPTPAPAPVPPAL